MIAPEQLIRHALAARKYAYAPYSNYHVGAALLSDDGTVYTGCNIENAAYTICTCAERTALFKAVSEGQRAFVALAVVGGHAQEEPPLHAYAYPCGVCRQALHEFAPQLRVIVATAPDAYQEHPLHQLLPHAFGPHALAAPAQDTKDKML